MIVEEQGMDTLDANLALGFAGAETDVECTGGDCESNYPDIPEPVE